MDCRFSICGSLAALLLVPATHNPAIQQQAGLLANGGFERASGGQATGWAPFGSGYALDSMVRQSGTHSIHCVNGTASDVRGALADVVLNQREPAPLLVSGWSRAKDVSGAPDSDYSVYVDLELADGTPLWGQDAPFSTGTHGWQRRQVLITPDRPIRSARIYALFRHHTGEAWFDDFQAVQLTGSGFFDSQRIAPPRLPSGAQSGWYWRDVSAGGPVLSFQRLRSGAVNSSVPTILQRRQSASQEEVWIGGGFQPQAITVYYVERFSAPDALWWNDVRHSLPAGSSGERANLTRAGNVGATGSISLYPFGCVTGGAKGRAVGVPPLQGPWVCRIGYNAGAKLLYVAFDVATTRDHITARLSVAHYDVDPTWGFRSAADRYYRMFPEAFRRRARAEGIWIPFTDPASVDRVDDFGIAYHEGDNSVASDDKLGILSFRYSEPMTWWMVMPPAVPRTYEAAMGMVREYAAGKSPDKREWAQVLLDSGSQDENGRFNHEFQNAPWANGAVWVLNPNPRLPQGPDHPTRASQVYTPQAANRRYGPSTAEVRGPKSGLRSPGSGLTTHDSRLTTPAHQPGMLDGEYLDSLEGWADVLDYRPESLRYAEASPTFSTDAHRPVVPTWFDVWSLARYMGEDLHRRGKLLMANSTPWRFWVFAPLLDVLGTETNWLPGGQWRPDSDALFNLRRTLCYHKPYLLLQNTDFEKFGTREVERYFQRSMFYGVYPSMFSVDAASHPYWQEPRWYNRDRPLFRKYIPLIKRLSAAGWEPLTYARSENPSVYVERFGTEFLTVLNDSAAAATASISLDLARWGLNGAVAVTDAVTGQKVEAPRAGGSLTIPITLQPGEGRTFVLVD